ncbi:MAG: glutamine--fructose-6-phosphate aminotransferase, partial [Desulfurivibrionaceae bacterium]
MCGIVGYIGKRRVVPILLEGLKRLEYRGYDSAGLVYVNNDDATLKRHRCEGKLANLEELMEALNIDSQVGLGHTRWATHGAPSEANAHPHCDCSGELVVVHNGIIENYNSLRDELIAKGHCFDSETDTEVLAHLIEENLEDDLAAAVRKALVKVKGSYALAVLWIKQPDRLIAVRNNSPLVLGFQENGGAFLASDIPALLPYTREIIFLDDREMAILKADSWQVLG